MGILQRYWILPVFEWSKCLIRNYVSDKVLKTHMLAYPMFWAISSLLFSTFLQRCKRVAHNHQDPGCFFPNNLSYQKLQFTNNFLVLPTQTKLAIPCWYAVTHCSTCLADYYRTHGHLGRLYACKMEFVRLKVAWHYFITRAVIEIL